MAIRVYSRLTTTVISIISFFLTASTIFYAFHQKKQFYPAVIHITKSSPSMAVLYLQGLVIIMLAGKILGKIFFGQLRTTEVEHLMERSWYAVTETCLAFTVFRDDFSTRFVTMFAFLLFFKCFHWLTEDRIDYMERTPVLSMKFHIRVTAMIVLLSLVDTFFIRYAYYFVMHKGASVQIVFGFEYMILVLSVLGMLAHYILHTIDSWQTAPWEAKSAYLLYIDLMLHFCRLVLYILFFILMMRLHTFPLFIVRPAYLSLRAFKNSFRDVILSRRAIRYMNMQFPSLTREELVALGSDSVCIICREDMATDSADGSHNTSAAASSSSSSSTNTIKRLPCQHVFHVHCLRTWFQRQQTCPTCRMDILRAVAAQRSTPASTNNNTNVPSSGAATTSAASTTATTVTAASPVTGSSTSDLRGGSSTTGIGGFVRSTENITSTMQSSSSASFMLPFLLPPNSLLYPPVPSLASADLARFSDEELHRMEGSLRESVEARIRCLTRVNILLDAAMLQMNAYRQAFSVNSLVTSPNATATATTNNNTANNEVTETKDSSETTATPSTLSGGNNNNVQSIPSANNVENINDEKGDMEQMKDEEDENTVVMRRKRLERFESRQISTTSSTTTDQEKSDGCAVKEE